jgi:hypothetical protein
VAVIEGPLPAQIAIIHWASHGRGDLNYLFAYHIQLDITADAAIRTDGGNGLKLPRTWFGQVTLHIQSARRASGDTLATSLTSRFAEGQAQGGLYDGIEASIDESQHAQALNLLADPDAAGAQDTLIGVSDNKGVLLLGDGSPMFVTSVMISTDAVFGA